MKDIDFSDYTPEEIAAFPLEMACCFYFAGWNKSYKFENIDGWAQNIGWAMYASDETPMEAAVLQASQDVRRLVQFIHNRYYYFTAPLHGRN